jgi:3-hydroxy acid dehydrogenase/malonic semialdehyde reductase
LARPVRYLPHYHFYLIFRSFLALITGASSGIGASTAVLFAKAGSNVVILARRANNLSEVKAKCEAAHKEFGHKDAKVVTIEADMQKREDLNSIPSKLDGLTVDM